MRKYTFRHAVAIIGGIACITAETFLNITHVFAPAHEWWMQPLVIAIGVAGLAQAIAASLMTASFREGRIVVGLITLVGLAIAISFSFATSYMRIAETAQDRRIERDARLNKKVRSLDGMVRALEDNERKECASVGPECRKLRKELIDARTALAANGSIVETNTLGALSILPELALPAMLLLLGLAFIGYAEAPDATRQTSFPADDELPDPGIFAPIDDEKDERAAKVKSFSDEYRSRHGRDPSVRTIAKATSIPPTSVHRAKRRARA